MTHRSAERECDCLTAVRNVLIAEDDPAGAEYLAQVLERSGHQVRVVYDGEAAVAAALIDPPDVMIVDIGLPRLDGWTVARRIREGLNGRRCLMVAVTGADEPGDRERSRRAGIQRHLVKPVAPGTLTALLDRDWYSN
jgi:two-component system, OmpR family, response regulator